MCSFICFTVVTHFLTFLTSSKASRLKSWHEIKTGLIYFTAHTAALTVNDSSVHVTPKKNAYLCNLSSEWKKITPFSLVWKYFSLVVMSARPDLFNPAPSVIYRLHPASCANLMQDTHQFWKMSQYRTKKCDAVQWCCSWYLLQLCGYLVIIDHLFNIVVSSHETFSVQ